MGDIVIKVENLSKEYRLGTINHGTLKHDLQSWWARIRGKEDPNSVISFSRQSATNSSGLRDAQNPHFLALKDVSFEVKRGEILGIIGKNGAGKSTLLKVLSRVTSPTKGVVKIKGRIASLLEVGTGFHPELTGRENIFLNGAILGMTKKEISRKFDEIVAFAEVEQFIDTPVKRYSSGMYVRLAFAVAAHLEPEILIVDEVLAVGDAQFQKKCLGKMDDVAKGGRTILFVSHNMVAVERLCQTGVYLDGGKIRRTGEIANIIDSYQRSNEQRRGEPLAQRSDRTGNGLGRLTTLEIKPAEENNGAITCNSGIRILIEYKAAANVSAIVLSIINHQSTPIYWLDSRNDAGLLLGRSKAETAMCITAPLNLVPGVYSINAALLIGKEVADQVESAAFFEVEAEDFYGQGRLLLPAHNHGVCLIRQSWTIV
jgi:lipopolysaccharide transport system ATP-binding protein